MRDIDINNLLLKKLKLLEEIKGNTEIQLRFVKRREIRGLKRLLRERECLLNEIFLIDGLLNKEEYYEGNLGIIEMFNKIKNLEDAIVLISQKVIKETRNERINISEEIKKIQARKRIQNTYIKSWYSRGAQHYNKKG